MLEVTAPDPLAGDSLRAELAAAGITVGESDMVLDRYTLRFPTLRESDRATVETVSAAHTGDPSPSVAIEAGLRDQAKTGLAVLRTSVDTLKTVTDKTNANIGPADTKTIARETRRVARQMIALTRLFLRELDSADTGSAE